MIGDDTRRDDERRRAVRLLLMRPLLHVDRDPEGHRLVRRHADWLRQWFADETGWSLHVGRTVARLRKVPATADDTTRPARARAADPPFSRRRYVLACLALAAVESEERQTTLGRIAERIVTSVAADPDLADAGIAFTLTGRDERRDLVAVIRLLLDWSVLRRVDGSERAYVEGTGDALYTVDPASLAAFLAARTPPSMIDATDIDGQVSALGAEPIPDTDDTRNRAIRQHLTRRLVDDAVTYHADLTQTQRDYLARVRHRIVTSVADATGLLPEIRAEGIAMVDERGDCTDVTMPDQGTDGHLTLLVAEHLADRLRHAMARGAERVVVPLAELESRVAALAREHAAHWRADTREPGAEAGLVADTIDRLEALCLVRRVDGGVSPLAAIARYRLDEPVPPPPPSLFNDATPTGATR
jgi:uncharacterized protein (TIGR02678 family)